MSYSVMFALLLLTPLLFSLLCFACRKRRLSATRTVTVLHSLGITLLLILALWVVQTAADAGEIFAAGLWLHIDGLGGLRHQPVHLVGNDGDGKKSGRY